MNRILCLVPAIVLPSVANADAIFGLNSPVTGGGIYMIDTDTGNSVLYRNTPTITAGVGGNGLAYDQATDSFYYVTNNDRLIRCSASGELDLGPVPVSSQVASGTFYNGAYWYHPDNTNRVYRAAFPTPVTTSISYQIVPNFPTTALFGDIASLPDGTTYASFSGDMRRYDLDFLGGGCIPLAGATLTLQLAFSGSTLWGVSSTDRLYTINTLTGVSAPGMLLQDASLTIIDAATVPAPASALLLAMLPLMRRRR